MPPKKRSHSKVESEDTASSQNTQSIAPTATATIKSNAKRQHTEASHTLYISNLNSKIKPTKMKENLYILFTSFADILEINYPRRNQRGQAWIVVSSPDDAEECVSKLDGFSVFDQPLEIQHAKKDSKIIQTLKTSLEEAELAKQAEQTE